MAFFPRPLLPACLGLLSLQAFALEIHVAPGGSDAAAGTKAQPLATLTAARDLARKMRKDGPLPEPVTILVQAGEYFMTEPLVLAYEDSGTESAPMVIKGEPGPPPIFYGAQPITGFTEVSGSLWKTEVPQVRLYGWRFEQLYVNGHRAVRAIAPNEGFFGPIAVTETALNPGEPAADFAVQKIVIPGDAAKLFENLSQEELNNTVATFYHAWDNTRKPVLSFRKEEDAIYLSGGGMKPWNPIKEKSQFTIENNKNALDAPGEWFLEPGGTLYYRPLPGEKPGQTTCLAPTLEKLVIIRGEGSNHRVSHVRFENLAFQVAAYRMPHLGVDPVQAAAPVEAAVQLDFAEHITFSDIEIAHTGGTGIWFRQGCADSRLEHSWIHDLGASGVKIGETTLRQDERELTRGITVDNCIVQSGGHVFPCAVGVTIFHGASNTLTHNDIGDFRYSGVSVGWVWGYGPSPSRDNRVEFNHIHHLGWGVLSDMGGVYTLGISPGTVISNNVIHHVYSFDYGGWGLYTDEGSSNILMENNLVYACKNAGFHQHYGQDNIIRNNIFANSLKGQLQASRVEDHQSLTFTNNLVYWDSGDLLVNHWKDFHLGTDQNCYWDTRTPDIRFGEETFEAWQASGKDKDSVVADPGFVDPANGDYHLKNDAVAKKIGFKPFDYTQAGVYGSEAWKARARLDPALETDFGKLMK